MIVNMMGIRNENGLEILDQTKLPFEQHWIPLSNLDVTCEAICSLRVRGAPLIGITAALFLAQRARCGESVDKFLQGIEALASTRPTAVNLFHYLKEIKEATTIGSVEGGGRKADEIVEREIKIHQQLIKQGEKLVHDGDTLLTHCNTGSLATVGQGTALGVIKQAHMNGKKVKVYVDETRPLLQGARLTCFELVEAGIEHELICDSMAAMLMKQKKVNSVWIGADRIANNGDAANKIGSYGLGVQASFHKVPMYVVAPTSTIDFDCRSGDDINIELRSAKEVRGSAMHDLSWAPQKSEVYNPAFDVVDAGLYTGLVTERGCLTTKEVIKSSLSDLLK